MKNHSFKVDQKVEKDGKSSLPDNLYLSMSRDRALEIISRISNGMRHNPGDITINFFGQLFINQ